jgi:hypothetical protein
MATITQPRTNLTATEARGEVRWGEWLIENLIRLAGLSTIVIIGLIFFFLVPAFHESLLILIVLIITECSAIDNGLQKLVQLLCGVSKIKYL